MAYDVKYIGEKEEIKPYLDNREDRIESEFQNVQNTLNNNDLSLGAITFNRGTRLGVGTLSDNTKLYQKGEHIIVSDSGTISIQTNDLYLVNVSLWINCEGSIPSGARVWLSIRQNSDLYEHIEYVQSNDKYKSINFSTVIRLGEGNVSLYSKTDGFTTAPVIGVGSPVVNSKMSISKI